AAHRHAPMTLARHAPVRLASRTRLVAEGTDLLSALGARGFAWLHEGAGFATSGVAATISLGTGPGRFAKAAEEVAAVLQGIDVDDPLELPGTGPIAVGAIPFLDGGEAELVVPARVLGRSDDGRAWVTE